MNEELTDRARSMRRPIPLSEITLRRPTDPIVVSELLEEADGCLTARDGDQPLPVSSNRPSVQRIVIDRLTDRMHLGVQRYGTTLQAHNGRNAGRDLREELYDALVYAEQVAIEQADLDAAVFTLMTVISSALVPGLVDRLFDSEDQKAAVMEALSRHAERQS